MGQVVSTPAELRAFPNADRGFVPTMGALHAGHLDLIKRAASEHEQAVVSIFVNPAQFSNAGDLDRYPRDLASDAQIAFAAGAHLIYAPQPSTIYGTGFSTWVDPGPLGDRWEGAFRPGHFRGVATVVTILLNTVRPRAAYFGEKDFQQLQIIRRMHHDLVLPGDIVGHPTIRDQDGLALSSRNSRLSPDARARARAIPDALRAMQRAADGWTRKSAVLENLGMDVLAMSGISPDYLAVVDAGSLEPVPDAAADDRILLAAEVGGVRLIDNMPVVPIGGA